MRPKIGLHLFEFSGTVPLKDMLKNIETKQIMYFTETPTRIVSKLSLKLSFLKQLT